MLYLLVVCWAAAAVAASDSGEKWFWNSTTQVSDNATTTTTLPELFSDDFAPANVTRGRNSRVLDLDHDNEREARILNEDPGNRRLAVQGYIPVVALPAQEAPRRQKALPQYYISPPRRVQEDEDEEGRVESYLDGIRAQYLAEKQQESAVKDHRFGGAKEPNVDAKQFGVDEGCVCVPFYLCRDGYLTGARDAAQPPLQDDIDERSISPKKERRSAGNETTVAPYTEDIMARMVGLQNVGDSCGLLRRCCRRAPPLQLAPPGLLPFSPDNYPFPQPTASPVYEPPHYPQAPPRRVAPPGLLPFSPDNYPLPQSTPSFILDQPHYPQQGGHQQIVLVQEPPRPNPHRSLKPIRHQPIHQPAYQPANQPVYKPVRQPAYQPSNEPVYEPAYQEPAYHPAPHRPAAKQFECGARNGFGIHGRVNNLQYHDDASEFGEYPWQAAILLKVGPGNNLFVCGGTLIAPQWIATAAHCLKKHRADELKVRLGDWDVHRDDEFYPYVEAGVVAAAVHPDFYPGNLHNDLALLKLEHPVDMQAHPHIRPACLPRQDETFDRRRCWVTGWGKNAFGEQGEYQSVLKEVDVPMLSHGECQQRLRQTRLGRSYALHPGFVCAGGEPGKDACTGDGGSPLVCEGKDGAWRVTGLVSWGIGCGQAGVPGVYVNVARYRNWIDAVVHGHRG